MSDAAFEASIVDVRGQVRASNDFEHLKTTPVIVMVIVDECAGRAKAYDQDADDWEPVKAHVTCHLWI